MANNANFIYMILFIYNSITSIYSSIIYIDTLKFFFLLLYALYNNKYII